MYVGDVVRAFLAAADADRPGIWNIGTGAETSRCWTVVRIIGEIAGPHPGSATGPAPAR